MKHSHKLFSLLALASFIQISFAMGGKPQKNKSGDQPTTTSSTKAAKWEVQGNTLKLREGANIKESIELYDQNGEEPVPGNPGARMLWGEKSTVSLSDNGKVAVHIQQKYKSWGEGAHETETKVRALDTKGATLWEKNAVDLRMGIHISENGELTTLVLNNIDGCQSAMEIECRQTLVTTNLSGKEIFKLNLGPVSLSDRLQLSKNGRYGMIQVFNSDEGMIFIFFDTETGKVIKKNYMDLTSKGEPVLKENGIIEIIIPTYENESSDKIISEKLIEKFEIK